MATTYPTDLFPVPADRWGFEVTRITGNATKVNEMNEPIIYAVLDGDNIGQVERRALSVLHHDYEDELDGAVATASQAGGRWFVTVWLRPYL